MRVLMTAWAWPTHYTPMVPLVWALRAAGHDVCVASQPALTGVITESGATAVPVGHDLDHDEVRQRAMRDLRLTDVPQAPPPGASTAGWSPSAVDRLRRVFGVFTAYTEAMIDPLLEFARGWGPDLIVYEPTTYAGPLAAAVLGVPAVRHIHGVDVTYQAKAVVPELIAPVAARLGIPAPDVLGQVTIDPCPPSMQAPGDVRRVAVRFVPYNGPAVTPDWLRAAPVRRRICVTWGTSTTRLAGTATFLAPRVIAAAEKMNVDVIAALSPRDAQALGEVPVSVRVAPALALHLVLPTCDAVIHQGGNGTILTSALYGVPQLILPQLPDQVFNAGRVAETGAGLSLRGDQAGEDALGGRLEEILTAPGYRANAMRIRDEMRAMPPPAYAVPKLQALAGPLIVRSLYART
jgi:UDP:flavonoid glycosyltransferase YjiC (YdhE family)